jgi:4-hydroxybenzoate polyprenyltransferase
VDSVSLAAFVLGSGFPDPVLLLQFGLGSVLLRGAGCTVNDLWDADIDRKVSRTVSRPLASGELSRKEALAFLAAQLVAGWFLLVSLPHTLYCVRWGVASLPLVATYPAMKRFFRYPQLVLGLTMNWGAFMGCAAVNGTMDYHLVLPLFGSGVAWTLVYDTIYAHQDKADDAKLGLQSTALAFGSDLDRQRALLTGLATVAYLQWLHVAVLGNSSLDLARQSAFFWIASLGGMTAAYGHLLWQVRTVNFSSPESCLRRFQSNQYTGALVFASLVATKFCSV